MNKNAVPFAKTSVSKQIERLHAAFSDAAQLPAYSRETDTELGALLQQAAQSVEKLRRSGKTEHSQLYFTYAAWIDFLLAEQFSTFGRVAGLRSAGADFPDRPVYCLHILILQKLYRSLKSHNPKSMFTIRIFPYTSAVFKISALPGKYDICLHQCFISMTDDDIESFSDSFGGHKWRTARTLLKPISTRKDAQQIYNSFQQGLPAQQINEKTAGKYFDLEEVFAQANKKYFGGKVARPQLRWSAHANRTRMGSYDTRNDILMVNCALDKRGTPAYVVDFIMYHELLHKKLGVETKNGRRIAHSSEFREHEKLHPYYAEAEEWLKTRKK